ncbi:MAG: NUDIX domain-containing protein [Eudoraea sp.]|uniref:NUDIX hydrolase n=1 Tax=Eudoraea sp. TaxID=1979955 RepID=UPI003C76C67E
MILKKQETLPNKKSSPFVGILLFIVSLILLILTGPLGFLYGILYSLFTKGFRGIGEYLLKIAVSIDQLGNVLMQYLLNALWVKRGGYKFGNRDETISSALGRNKRLGTLTRFGLAIDKILDTLDPNHSLNSIDYYIEPSQEVLDVLAWIHMADNRILCTRSSGKDVYYIPGGKREPGESDTQALSREIKEELQVTLDISSLKFMGIFEARAHGVQPGVMVRMKCYTGGYTGELCPDFEISEMVWLSYSDKNMVAEVDKLIFDFLNKKGYLI